MPEKRTSRYAKLHPLPCGSVRWTKGLWAQRLELCHKVTLPAIRRAMDNPTNGAVLSNFTVTAGLTDGQHHGTDWGDGDCYKWLEAMTHVYGITGDPALIDEVDEWIDIIAQAQDTDGYISTQIQLTNKGRWQCTHHHELYNMGHLMTAACVHYTVTGKNTFLLVARKLADYLYGLFRPRPAALVHFPWNPSNIMGLVDLYRVTEDPRYLELAGAFVDMRGTDPQKGGVRGFATSDGTDQNQDRVPFRQESEAVGHAVTATYLYCGAADVYAETGETDLLQALNRIWDDVTKRKMYITGAVGAHHQTVSRRGDKVWEAFGLGYELPNATAYNETCANIGHAMWNWRMVQLTGDARYVDVMEQVLYNSGLSGISIDGQHFCYTNPLRWHGTEHQRLSHDTASRWSTHDCYCCPPQVARTIARMHTWAYGLSDEGVWVHLYGGSRLDLPLDSGSRLCLVQETAYPWEGVVRITVEAAPARSYGIMLRIPSWARKARVKVNGQVPDVDIQPGTYAALRRRWSVGDVIELDLPMSPRLVQAHPKVEEAFNQIAVMRGPLVYCLESVDLPDRTSIDNVFISRGAQWTAKFNPDLLGGLVVLEGVGYRAYSTDWTGQLYRDLAQTEFTDVPIRLIPYYAWNNRGATKMTVWLPLLQ